MGLKVVRILTKERRDSILVVDNRQRELQRQNEGQQVAAGKWWGFILKGRLDLVSGVSDFENWLIRLAICL